MLPDKVWKSPELTRRLTAEAGFECNHGIASRKHYWFTVPHADTMRGEIELRNFEPSDFQPDPHSHQKGMAVEIRKALQMEAHHDGVWIAGWTHPPEFSQVIREDGDNVWYRLVMIWLDGDGDPQYTLESDLPVFEMIQHGIDYYIDLAQQAHAAWSEAYGKQALKEDFGIKEEQVSRPVLEALH